VGLRSWPESCEEQRCHPVAAAGGIAGADVAQAHRMRLLLLPLLLMSILASDSLL